MDSALAVTSYQIPFGVVDVADGSVIRFHEKPDSNYLVNAGLLVLGPIAFNFLESGSNIARTLELLAEQHVLAAVRVNSQVVTVDSLPDIAEALHSPILDA